MNERIEPSVPLVTEVRIRLTGRPPILAYVAVTLWGQMVIHDLRVLERQDGSLVVLMPRLQGADGRWSPVAFPVREWTRVRIENVVLAAYRHMTAEGRAPEATSA